MKIWNLWRKWIHKSIFSETKSRGNGTFTACVLKTPLPGQIPTLCWCHVQFTFATMHTTDADVTFYDGPGMHTVKAAKQVYSSMWIALLKHRFVLVKTWLLIACSTGFYAIMYYTIELLNKMTKPTKWLCAQRRLRSAWASAQSDQSLCCALNG